MEYVNSFFVFSILGHFIENFFYTAKDSGILYGYWTPIYGFGVVITIILFNFFNRKKTLTSFKKFIISFLIGFVGLTLLELLSGFLIERLLKVVFWDYSNQTFSIFRYTSLKMAFIWGLSSLVIIYVLKPFLDKYMKCIPRAVSYCLITLFAIDFIISLSPYLIN